MPTQQSCLFRGQGQGSLGVWGAFPWLPAVNRMKPGSPGIPHSELKREVGREACRGLPGVRGDLTHSLEIMISALPG